MLFGMNVGFGGVGDELPRILGNVKACCGLLFKKNQYCHPLSDRPLSS